MLSISLADLVSILSGSGILGALGFLGKRAFDRKRVNKQIQKMGAENVQILTSTNISQLEYMSKEVKDLQTQLKEARSDMAELRGLVRKLLNELSDHRELTTGEQKIIDGL